MQLTITLHIIFFWCISFSAFSQPLKRDNVWMLCGYSSNEAGLDFNNGTADTFSVNRQMWFFFTNASICDTNGQLLFYSNGNLVCDRFHNYMTNTGGFNPGYHNFQTAPYGQGIFQGILILPRPDHPEQYVIFHESADTFYAYNEFFERPMNLSYSVVDMTQSNGDGAITAEKNIHIIDDTLVNGKLMACKHANGRDWWIVTHRLFSNEYYKILLTPDTILQYNVQSIGSNPEYDDALGATIFSQTGDKFISLNYDTLVDILDFDRCTGDFSNVVTFSIPDGNLATLGCALSGNGRYLYVSTDYHIFQFDTWSANIASSRITVGTWDGTSNSHGFSTSFFYMRLAPDNKIYISTGEGTDQLHVIDYPDSSGIACNVRQHGLFLPSYNAFSMPNGVNYSLGAIPGSICDTIYYLATPQETELINPTTIFPNPANNEVKVAIGIDPGAEIIYRVYDIFGHVVMNGSTENKFGVIAIEVSSFPNGIYFLRLQSGGSKVFNGKFVIAR